jgi:hypothetical protein
MAVTPSASHLQRPDPLHGSDQRCVRAGDRGTLLRRLELFRLFELPGGRAPDRAIRGADLNQAEVTDV